MEELHQEKLKANKVSQPGKPLILFLHGAWHTSACYEATPDGRPGWARLFTQLNYPVVLVDLLGHGQSPAPDDFFTMSTVRHSEALNHLLDKLGPVVIICHSLSAQIVWKAVDLASPETRANFLGIVAVAPCGPGNLADGESDQLAEDQPFALPDNLIKHLFCNTSAFPQDYYQAYADSLVVESPHAFNTLNSATIAKAEVSVSSSEILAGIPTLVVGGEKDGAISPNYAEAIAGFFGKPCILVDRDWGLGEHGHLLMLEYGSEQIAYKIADWVSENV
jgi:pimeloyl-ACP methyl ester carboxylesterase